jgi:hypothetical protein
MFVMNDCNPGTIPHLYSQQGLAGKTVNWVGTDNPNNATANWNNPDTRARMQQSGWNDTTVIEYKFNQQCFRTDEFDQSSRILVLGCSFTIGVGLHLDQTWPSQFGKLIGKPTWNLATGSANIDTCYRILKHYLPYLNVSTVIMCEPENDRFEIWTNKNGVDIVTTIVNSAQNQLNGYTDLWYSSIKNSTIQYEKTLEAMHNICDRAGVKFLHFHRHDASKKYYGHTPDESRCLKHLGPNSQRLIAQYARDILLS